MAILGLLSEASMHGYELRKRLTEMIGPRKPFSFGTLYPTLRRLAAAGLIAEDEKAGTFGARRAKRVYALTESGCARLDELLGEDGPEHHTDDGFGVHLAFFRQTPPLTRVRVLEGRRRKVEGRRERLRTSVACSGASDKYTGQLNQLTLENTEREIRWLNALILSEEEGPEMPADRPRPGVGDND